MSGDSKSHRRAKQRADRHTKDEVVDDLVDLLNLLSQVGIGCKPDWEVVRQIEQKYGYKPFE